MEKEIRDAINKALLALELPEADFVVEHPTEISHGDYACNVAMVVSKSAGKAPRVIAEQLLAALEGNIPNVARLEVAGPGFLNFYLTRSYFTEKTVSIGAAKDTWGHHMDWAGKKVLVEYTDPNPFKEFHVGHLFTNTVGESISRLFKMGGANVECCNYQGDVGMHVASTIYGMQQLGFTVEVGFSARDLGKAYASGATAYKEADPEVVAEIKRINKAVYERTDDVVNALYDAGRSVSLAYFEGIYEVLGTKFDHYFFESEAGPKGKELVLSNSEVFVESDGARVFVGEEYGLHTRVFINSEGLPTYEAKELALAKMKEERTGVYDHSIISTSNEITEYFKVLKKAMSFVYPELAAKTEHIGHGTVRLSTGKMSSRTGDIISAIDFISDIKNTALEKMSETSTAGDEALATDIAIAAIKYATLKGNILQDSVFDKDKALSFEGDSGPYLQYTHARICTVLQKAKAAGVNPSTDNPPENPYDLEHILYRFPEITSVSLTDRAPHYVVTYLTQLAGVFNTFYATEKIADDSDEYAPYKAALAEAVAVTLKNGLWILGIKAPERM